MSPRGKEIDYIKIPKVIFPGTKGVSIYCFTGLSNESPKRNVLLFGGNILLASFWNKINLIKFAFFDFTLKLKKRKKTLELKKKDEIIQLILRYSSGDIFVNTCSES